MSKRFKSYIAFILMLAVICIYPAQTAFAKPWDFAVLPYAEVSASPQPQIRLNWRAVPSAAEEGYTVYRKAKEATSWGDAIHTGTALSYTDTNVAIGQTYEYKITSTSNPSITGYVLAGINVPAAENRGTVVLLVESEQLASAKGAELEAALAVYKNDLIGDGWSVIRHDVSRNATPAEARALVQADYNANPDNVKAVFLIGKIPILRVGNYSLDGHGARPWPADAYYGEMVETWSNTPTPLNRIPGTVQLQVGRAYFSEMPSFAARGKDETTLLIQYLNKNHKYRIGGMPTTKNSFVLGGFWETESSPAKTAYRDFTTFFGNNTNTAGLDTNSENWDWKTALSKDSYTWVHLSGAGAAGQVFMGTSQPEGFTTANLADPNTNYTMIFNQVFGSYFCEWDLSNNLMRALLSTENGGLACMWSGRGLWYLHHMGLGETIGYSTRLTQNNGTALYTGTGDYYNGYVHVALMGDPTLRMFPVMPAAKLQAIGNAEANETTLIWNESLDKSVHEYYIYGATDIDGPYERLAINDSTLWTHKTPGDIKHYMVRAAKLTTTGSGSFTNLSQGVMAETAYSGVLTAKVMLNAYALNKASADAFVYNTTGTSANIRLSLALYNASGQLLDTTFTNTVVDSNGGGSQLIFLETPLSTPDYPNDCYLRAFVWVADTLEPLDISRQMNFKD